MEQRVDKNVKEQLPMEWSLKIEVEEEVPRTAYLDTEIDVTHLKQEPGLKQSVKREPVLLVKKEILQNSSQDKQQGVPASSTRAIVGSTSVAVDSFEQGELLHIKEELEDTDLDIGPTVLQHIDSHYGTKQTILNDIKQENAVLNLKSGEVLSRIYDGQVVHSQVRDEAIESSLKDNAALVPCNSITSKKGLVQSQLYTCKVCKQNYRCQRHLWKHTYQVHGGEHSGQIYKCDKCPKVCKSKEYLRNHSSQVHATGSHKCTQCNKEFKCKQYLGKHVRNIHSDEQFECVICKKMHKSRASLHVHVSDFHRHRFADREHGNYSCDKCMKTFQSKTGFKRHCENMHGTERYKCTECDKEYKCMRYLKIHINGMHRKQQFECDICKRKFKSRKKICRHILSHHSTRLQNSHLPNYTCDHCQKSFRNKSLLRAHIKAVHGERTYQCQKCNKAFKCRNNLQQHKKGFHGKPQYKCEVCQRLFKTRNILRVHVKEAHSMDDIPSKLDLYSQEVYNPLSIVGGTSAVVGTGNQHHGAGNVKSEPADAELKLGLVVFQHMDSNYRPCKEEPQLD